jgi:CheY-like chemotaxis protein
MRRVLLIEDDASQAEALQQVLQTTGVEIEVANTGMDGLEKARRLRPNLVLCDIGLPDIDGSEVARRIRDDPELRSTRLIALSAHSLPEDREEAGHAGFDEYIVKPPPFDALERLVADGDASTRTVPRRG